MATFRLDSSLLNLIAAGMHPLWLSLALLLHCRTGLTLVSNAQSDALANVQCCGIYSGALQWVRPWLATCRPCWAAALQLTLQHQGARSPQLHPHSGYTVQLDLYINRCAPAKASSGGPEPSSGAFMSSKDLTFLQGNKLGPIAHHKSARALCPTQ